MTPKHCHAAKMILAAWMLLFASHVLAADRAVLNFNPEWKFIKEDPANAQKVDFDDSKWAVVSAPHTYNDVDTFDDYSLPGHHGELNQWGGKTWYRKTFDVPQEDAGKKIYIEFEAVRQIAQVYLNGQLLGTAKTGFIPFGFDLTPYVKVGQKNVLALQVDNSFTHETDMKQIVNTAIPWNSPHWHPAHGGIYRNVRLYVLDPLHISLPLYSFLQTEGPYVYGTDVTANNATLGVEVPVENGRSSQQNIEVDVNLVDHDGNTVLSLKKNDTISGGEKKKIVFSDKVPNPHLWQPDFPYLYNVVCSVKVGSDTVDSTTIPYGFRSVKFDAQTGFFINGQHVKLHGWGQKPTDEWPGLGAAQPDWMHFYTLDLMKEAGGNWVRWGHCAAGQEMIAAGDQLGIMFEQPGCDGEGDATGDAWTLRASAFRDMLIYFRNHPSIMIWEGGNQKVTREHVTELRGYFDKYDPHGQRAYAHRRADKTDAEFMDVCIGTEGGREIATLPVVEGEYDREESPRRVWDDYSPPNFGYPEAKGMTYDLTSEQYAVNEVKQFVKKIGADNHSGGANWIFSDSTSGGRVPAEVARASGEVDGERLPKEAYYVCQTMFSDTPQVHVIGHWTYPANTKKNVYVVSNCQEIELFVNGKSLGHGRNSNGYLYTFPNVTWEPGEIKAVATVGGKTVATDAKHTVGDPVALKITPITGPGGLLADGSDIALFDVEAIDAKGDRCPTFQQRVDFQCEGPAIWRGGYNSGIAHSTNNTYLNLECGINRVAVRSTLSAGDITITANCKGLKSASETIKSSPVKIENGETMQMPQMPAVKLPDAPPKQEVAVIKIPQYDNSKLVGKYISDLNYSGPNDQTVVQKGADDGGKVYVDSDATFASLPAALKGSDYFQASQADSLYSAVDLMEIGLPTNVTVYIAHDDSLALPDWLGGKTGGGGTEVVTNAVFKPTDMTINVGGKPMKVYSHRVTKEESLTLGSNTYDTQAKQGQMYIVFVNKGGGDGATSKPARNRRAK